MTSPHTAGRVESPRVADMMRRYAEARARLMNGPPKVKPAVLPSVAKARQRRHKVPLNMLAPCSWRFLLALAAVRGGVTADSILGAGRLGPVAKARFDAMALVYRHTQQSMPGVGRLFNRDHTTVLHALKLTGARQKLVELLPSSDAARRPKGATPAVIAQVVPTSVPLPAGKAANRVQRVVRAGYRTNKPLLEIAVEAGISPASVPVIASRMGLRRSDFRPKSKYDWEAAGL